MGLLQQASLVITPNAVKAGKLYSVIPNDGTGDLDVVRATSATRVNSAGLIETVSNNIARIDYSNGSCPSILVEPQRTNLVLRNDNFTVSPWLYSGVNISPTTAINSPDGTHNAFEVNILNTGFSQFGQIINVANNTTYTISCFYKNKNMTLGQTFEFRYTNELAAPNNLNAIATINLVAGTATFFLSGTEGSGKSGSATGTVQNYGDGWFRVTMTFTVGSSGASTVGRFRPAVGINIERNFYACGAQMEQGSNATSYIPTTTSSVTRNADVISKSGISNLIGQTEGTIYWEGSLSTNAMTIASLKTNSGSLNAVVFDIWADNRIYGYIVENNVLKNTIRSLSDITFNSFIKIAYVYKSGNCSLFINGVKQNTSSQAFTFNNTISKANIDYEGYNYGQAQGKTKYVKNCTVFPTILTDAQAIQLTTL